MNWYEIKQALIGKPLNVTESAHQLLPKWKAMSTLSSDALSSVAYATDATLVVLMGFSMAATVWSLPIAFAIVVLLVIITASYRQTIEAYPSGGGAYTVAKENLGVTAGLVAGTALLIDYVLTVSVSVAAGIENISSAFPFLNEHKIICGAVIVLVIMIMNLRGIKESSTIFAFPTYFFILSIIVLIAAGFWKNLHGLPATEQTNILDTVYPSVPMILILRAFGSGCSALTGVEAISNGVAVFRDPAHKNAKTTLIWMSALLGGLFLGISSLTMMYQIIPQQDQTVISLLGLAIFGKTFIYYLIQIATALILFLAANTSYADFPRLSSMLSRDRFLPRQLSTQGDRLVFSNGIIGLSLASIVLIVAFRGETLHMIPLYAIGVFLSFTLSQGGMVVHHFRKREYGWRFSLAINLTGAFTTLIVLLDIAYTKFMYGAWIVILSIPVLVWIFLRIHRHYVSIGNQLTLQGAIPWTKPEKLRHTVVIPISGIHKGVLNAIRYAVSIGGDLRICYVDINPVITEGIRKEWEKWGKGISFVVLPSPHRSVIQPVLDYIDDILNVTADDVITVLIPEFITTKWWHRFLHNQTAIIIKAALMFRKRVVVTTVRYHLED